MSRFFWNQAGKESTALSNTAALVYTAESPGLVSGLHWVKVITSTYDFDLNLAKRWHKKGLREKAIFFWLKMNSRRMAVMVTPGNKYELNSLHLLDLLAAVFYSIICCFIFQNLRGTSSILLLSSNVLKITEMRWRGDEICIKCQVNSPLFI